MLLRDESLETSLVSAFDKRKRVGKVIAQKPRKGKSLTKGAKVAVTVGKR